MKLSEDQKWVLILMKAGNKIEKGNIFGRFYIGARKVTPAVRSLINKGVINPYTYELTNKGINILNETDGK